jgi:hypothetical protein
MEALEFSAFALSRSTKLVTLLALSGSMRTSRIVRSLGLVTGIERTRFFSSASPCGSRETLADLQDPALSVLALFLCG